MPAMVRDRAPFGTVATTLFALTRCPRTYRTELGAHARVFLSELSPLSGPLLVELALSP